MSELNKSFHDHTSLENIQVSPEADFDSIYQLENLKQSGFLFLIIGDLCQISFQQI